MSPPLVTTLPQVTGGSVHEPCSGSIVLDFNAFLAANPSIAPPAGSVVHLQAWCSDPNSAEGTSLSDAAVFVLLP